MKYSNAKSSQSGTSANPTTLNLQTRPFAPIQADSDQVNETAENKSIQAEGFSSENLLAKLIATPTPEPLATPIRRKAFPSVRMPIQAKLSIGEPNDKYEKEADNTAAKVVQQINSSPQDSSVQKQESEEDELQMKPAISKIQRDAAMEDDELQMKSLVQKREHIGGGEASADLESSIQSARGSGQSLDPSLQLKMSEAMGADFSGVKVHTDSQSDQLNKSIQAKAFTTGQDVFFRQGAYEPSSRGGQELIAHELTHVVQQNGSVIQRDGEDEATSLDKAFEQRGKEAREENPNFIQIQELAKNHDFKNILKAYDSNWFTAKEHLAYATYAKDPQEYSKRMVIMKELLVYRKQETEAVLKPVMLSVATDVLGGIKVDEGLFKAKSGDTGYLVKVGKCEIDANAPGSQSLTSDIDISFGVPGYEEFEVDLVQQFNHAFRARWNGVEAGVVFDVNAYSSGFMSKASGHLAGEGYEEELGEKNQKKLGQSQKQLQLALGFLPIRKFFEGKDEQKIWDLFKQSTYEEISKYLNGKGLQKIVPSVRNDIYGIFKLTDELHGETKKEMDDIKEAVKLTRAENRLRGADQPELSEKHLEAVTGDMLYEAQLHKIRFLLEQRKKIVKRIEELKNKYFVKKKLQAYRDELAKNLIEAEREQGKALVYANEAYYTAGAAIHVVKGMQSGGAVQLSSQQQMASLLMNIGYKLMHYEHNEHEGGQGRALVATSKYGERIRDVVKQGMPEHMEEREAETKKKGAGGLYNPDFDPKLHEILKEELKVLDQEKNLIVNYKKTKRLESPSAREAKAQVDLGEEMNTDKQTEVYITIAVKALAPYYESEFAPR